MRRPAAVVAQIPPVPLGVPAFTMLAFAVLACGLASPLPAQVRIGDVYHFDRPASLGGPSATVLADENAATGAGGLTWSCADEGLRVTLSTTFLGRELRARVRYAFDDGPESETGPWRLAASGMAAAAPPDLAAEFTRRALAARHLRLEVSDFQFRLVRYTFGLSGLAEALALLPCGPRAGMGPS
ncbi:MAG: hypothetical protein RRA92_11475 [Gemmatimonadota bacterium]|nr:hypothetical protein [Gemmatimonadota bacterium]